MELHRVSCLFVEITFFALPTQKVYGSASNVYDDLVDYS